MLVMVSNLNSANIIIDGLSAEHFMYAGNYLKVYLSILFPFFISLGYLPDGFRSRQLF